MVAESAQTRQRSQDGRRASAQRRGKAGARPSIRVPYVTPQIRTTEVHLPPQLDFSSAADTVRAQLPSREQALFYGGLAAGAVFALIDWPVALAIGVGYALLNRKVEHPSATEAGQSRSR